MLNQRMSLQRFNHASSVHLREVSFYVRGELNHAVCMET